MLIPGGARLAAAPRIEPELVDKAVPMKHSVCKRRELFKKTCNPSGSQYNIHTYNMADKNAKSKLIGMKFCVIAFSGSLITNQSLKFKNKNWWIQHG